MWKVQLKTRFVPTTDTWVSPYWNPDLSDNVIWNADIKLSFELGHTR